MKEERENTICLDFWRCLLAFYSWFASLVALTTQTLMRKWWQMVLWMRYRKYLRQYKRADRKLRRMGLQPLTMAEILTVQPMVAPTKLQFEFRQTEKKKKDDGV